MAVSPDDFRRALRKFVSGVTIVTVSADDELHGATASSFASVSLDPPLILVCLDKASHTRALLLKRGSFAVNVLGADQAEVARAFSMRGQKPFDRLRFHLGSQGAPLFDDSIAWMECKTERVVEAGDHDIVIGEVTSCDATEEMPLMYYEADYRTLGDHP
jgi:flavin reductase (DIM6/NTAB) family NADH-FMN oxidoreductase RutF